MTLTLTMEQRPLRLEPDGTIRIGPTRVTLDTLVHCYRTGASAEEIVQQFPSLCLADVYGAIGYVLRHEAEVDRYLSERATRADEVRERIESDSNTQRIRQRLLAHRSAKSPAPAAES